eukprot:tig00000711_g3368.t1
MAATTSAKGDLTLIETIEHRVLDALKKAFGDAVKDANPMVTPSSKPEFGDYQCNAAMPLSKSLKKPPRAIAEELIKNLDVSEFCLEPTIAGPGFINLTLKVEFLQDRILGMLRDSGLAVPKAPVPKRVIVDFSSPNIAKEMHVGHLRSTIIGDCIARVLEFRGHDVLRLNHVGDWGTQFGMLITYLREVAPAALTTADAVDLGDLVEFYKKAKVRFDEDDDFKERSRKEVVRLQSGDAEARHAWNLLCEQSRREFLKIYKLLDIRVEERGESFYNPMLHDIIKELEEKGLLEEDQGAKVVFLDGYTNKEGNRQPLIVQKSDGGFIYATTDLAAVKHRAQTEKAERILYVTDVGQSTHFAQVFQVARRAGLVPPEVEVEHVPFGLVQGEGGKKLKTRAGDTVRLIDLLEEAVERSKEDLEKKMAEEGRTEDAAFVEEVSRVVGLSAVKYADLSCNRNSNYIFSFDRMLALNGNTGPYMLYAFVRIQGIARKGGVDLDALAADKSLKMVLADEGELALARHLVSLAEIVASVEKELLPNRLCAYIFDLSSKFNQFYDRCNVLNADEPTRTSRLLLCHATAKTIKLVLGLLGIDTLQRM